MRVDMYVCVCDQSFFLDGFLFCWFSVECINIWCAVFLHLYSKTNNFLPIKSTSRVIQKNSISIRIFPFKDI